MITQKTDWIMGPVQPFTAMIHFKLPPSTDLWLYWDAERSV
jgi:hypothetical protein